MNRLYNSKKRKEKLNLEITRNLKKNNEKIERKLKKIDMIILNESHKISNFIVNQGYKEIEIINMNFKNEKILSVIKKQLKYKCKLYKVKIFGI